MTKIPEGNFGKLNHLSGHMHRMSAEKMHDLDSPERRKILPPKDLLILASISPNDTVVDVGAGTGYFTLPAVKLTTGKVIAIDVNSKMLEYIQEKAQEQGVMNLTVMTGND